MARVRKRSRLLVIVAECECDWMLDDHGLLEGEVRRRSRAHAAVCKRGGITRVHVTRITSYEREATS